MSSRFRGWGVIVIVVAALTVVASVAFVDGAFASSASLSGDGTTLVIHGDGGDGFNDIDLARESDGAGGERFVIDEIGTDNSTANTLDITAGNGCAFDPDAVNETVWCPATSAGVDVATGTVDLRTGDDTFSPYGDIGITLTVQGGPGLDDITGGEKADSLFGDGNPALDEFGDPARAGDVLDGAEGRDSLDGGAGSWDDLSGGSGDDILTDAGGDEDVLKGDAGNDDLDGGPGDGDVLLGGTGADTLLGGGGVGDQVSYSERATGVTVDLDNSPDDGNSEDFDPGLNRSDNIGSGIEIVTGSYYGDHLTGSAGGDELRGSPTALAPWPVTALTHDDAAESDTAWSPGGTANENRIAFASTIDHPAGDSEIYTIDAGDGGNRVQLTNNSAYDGGPTWSPDGAKIAFESDRSGSSDIWVMNADGSGDPVNLTNDAAIDHDPAWSPNGDKIAFSSARDGTSGDLYVMDKAGPAHGILRLTSSSYEDRSPSWSPDSTQLVFATRGCNTGPDWISCLYTIEAGGSGLASPLVDGPWNDANEQPSWSPNGSEIAYVDGHAVGGGLIIKSAFDRNPGLAVNPGLGASNMRPGKIAGPAWSPDSERVVAAVYNINESYREDIYTTVAHYEPTGVEDTDIIDGGGGNDTLAGSRGDDEITAGPGVDTVSGGAGNDDIRIYDGEADGPITCDLTERSGNDDRVTADILPLDANIASDCETVNRGNAPPPAPTLTSTSPTSPSNSDTTPEIIGSAAGMTVDLYTASGCPAGALLVDDAPASAFNTSGVTATVSANSTTTFYATTTNGSGTSPCSSTLAADGSIAYTHDSIAPDAPTPTSTTPDSPSNSNTNPAVIGTAEAGSTVNVYKDACATSPVSDSAANYAAGNLHVSVPANATTTFRATATDDAGNTSGCSPGLDYTHDSIAPDAPTITDTDPPSPANENNPKVIGSAEDGSDVKIYTDPGCTDASPPSGDAATFASPGITASVADNTTTEFRASATDAAGNTSPCSAPFTYDEVTPSGEIKVFGTSLSLADNADTNKRKLAIRSKDLLIGIGAGNNSVDDPTLHGAKLRVRSDAEIPPFNHEYDLPATNWALIGTRGANKGYKYKDTLLVRGPIYSAQMRPGKPGKTGQLQFKGKGNQLDHTLATDPNAVKIGATIGAQRFCMEFGGTPTFTVNRYKAKNAAAPTGACPGP